MCLRHTIWMSALLLPPLVMANEEESSTVNTFCDSQKSAFYLSESSSLPPNAAGHHFSRKVVDWSDLLIVGPQTNQFGDPLRTGSKVRKVHCGQMVAEFTSGYFNANPQGELGAVDFPAVRLLMNKQEILPTNAFWSYPSFERGSSQYGDFPGRWADSIEARMVNGAAVVTVHRSMENGGGSVKTHTDTTVFSPAALAHSLCKPSERVVFTCPLNQKTVSVCASDSFAGDESYVQYRFGSRGKVEAAIPSDPAPFRAAAVAWQHSTGAARDASYLRFTQGGYRYYVYSASTLGVNAPVTDDGIRSEPAGVVVMKGKERVFARQCSGRVFDENMGDQFWGKFVRALDDDEDVDAEELAGARR